MLTKSHLLIGAILALGSVLYAEDPVEASSEKALEQLAAVVPVVKVSEAELVELVGYLTAQGAGVATLQLDEAGIIAMAVGLGKGLSGELTIQDFPQDVMQAAFGQAQARAEAV